MIVTQVPFCSSLCEKTCGTVWPLQDYDLFGKSSDEVTTLLFILYETFQISLILPQTALLKTNKLLT